MKLRAEDVFRPGAFPEHTYISRKSTSSNLSYEFRLMQALRISGFLTSLVGPSKMGKTSLCEKVIGFENIVEISGADFGDDTDFWKLISTKAGMAYEGHSASEKKIAGTDNKYIKKGNSFLTSDKIIEYYREQNLVLLIDNFHYAPEGKQMQIAQQLKDAIRKGFKAIVISLPYRTNKAIQQNPDLSGRLSLINMEPWEIDELKEIAKMGFGKLGITIEDSVAEQIAVESLSSPKLMQYICLNICTILEMSGNECRQISPEILETAYRYTTANFEYRDAVSLMQKGPNNRGKARSIFRMADGKDYDIYELIVMSLAENPPIMKLEFGDVRDRIHRLMAGDCKKPSSQIIWGNLARLQEFLYGKEETFNILDWEEGNIRILDPLFLFYLRWGCTWR